MTTAGVCSRLVHSEQRKVEKEWERAPKAELMHQNFRRYEREHQKNVSAKSWESIALVGKVGQKVRNCAKSWESVLTLAFIGQNGSQHSLFLKITTLVTWLKSTLLLAIKCFDIHIYMKMQCFQTNGMQHY